MITSTKVFRWFGSLGLQGTDEARDPVTFGYDPDATMDLETRQTLGPGVPPEWIDNERWQGFLHDPEDDRWYAIPRLQDDDLVDAWHCKHVPVVAMTDPMDELFLLV